MPRYFVRVKVNGKLLADDGPPEEFPDLEAVRAVVLESAREVLSQKVLKGTAASLDIQIEVFSPDPAQAQALALSPRLARIE